MRTNILSAVVVLFAFAAQAQDEGFGRYQVILDRKPFGDLPPVSENTAPPGPPPVSFAQSLRLSMIIEVDDGTKKIGFIDTRTGKPYTMGQGESQDGIEVVSADFEAEEVVLRQGSEMALMKLQSGEVKSITGQNMPSASSPPAMAPQSSTVAPSYAERRRLRQMEQQPPPPEPPKYSGEELAKHLQEYQMEVIRQGLPPLPIPLTPEQDAELVREGILPAVQ